MRRMPAAIVALLVASPPALAQRVQPELRVDALGPAQYTIEPSAGLIVPVGRYVRASIGAGYGERLRVDALGRFTLDPFRQQRWALSIGGGLSFRRRTYLAVVADLEGPEMRGWLPAFQVGLSGGFRAGIGVRRAIPGRR